MKPLEKLPRVDAERPFSVTVPFKVYHDGNHFVGHEIIRRNSDDKVLKVKAYMGGNPADDEPVNATFSSTDDKETDALFKKLFRQLRRKKSKKRSNGGKRVANPVVTEVSKRDYKDIKDLVVCKIKDELCQGQLRGRSSQNGVARRIVAELSERGHKDVEDFVARKIKDELRNVHARKKRFYRKAFLNRWNYFVTLTYSDEKMDADKFREKMRRCLSNLHTRRGWKYMGVYEYGDENGRLHFHALVYVPDGGMIGEIKERSSYNPKTGRMEKRNENSFFTRFGVNDFQQITATEVKHGNAVNYLLKYLEKQQQRIVYSRGIPSEICVNLCVDKLVVKFVDYVEKYVLFDDLIEWERDVMHYQYQYKQMSLFDDVG